MMEIPSIPMRTVRSRMNTAVDRFAGEWKESAGSTEVK